MSVLLSWLRDDDNYTKWKGSEGDTHIVLASDIAQLIKEAKTKVDRTPSSDCGEGWFGCYCVPYGLRVYNPVLMDPTLSPADQSAREVIP